MMAFVHLFLLGVFEGKMLTNKKLNRYFSLTLQAILETRVNSIMLGWFLL